MARIDWALMCETAFADQIDQMSIVGIVRALHPRELPFALHQKMLVARLADIGASEALEVVVIITAPNDTVISPTSADCVAIEMSREYVLVTLRDVPIRQEGTYRFGIALRGQPVVFVDIPVIPVHAAHRPEWATGVH